MEPPRCCRRVYFDPADMAHASAEIEIDAGSIYTGIQKRDDHLRSADFFDAATYPKIVFRSARAETVGGTRFRLLGDLTIRGTTRPVTLDVEYAGPVKSPFGGEITYGFTARTKINREDYGVMWNEVLEGGGVMVGREVEITVNVEADLTTD